MYAAEEPHGASIDEGAACVPPIPIDDVAEEAINFVPCHRKAGDTQELVAGIVNEAGEAGGLKVWRSDPAPGNPRLGRATVPGVTRMHGPMVAAHAHPPDARGIAERVATKVKTGGDRHILEEQEPVFRVVCRVAKCSEKADHFRAGVSRMAAACCLTAWSEMILTIFAIVSSVMPAAGAGATLAEAAGRIVMETAPLLESAS